MINKIMSILILIPFSVFANSSYPVFIANHSKTNYLDVYYCYGDVATAPGTGQKDYLWRGCDHKMLVPTAEFTPSTEWPTQYQYMAYIQKVEVYAPPVVYPPAPPSLLYIKIYEQPDPNYPQVTTCGGTGGEAERSGPYMLVDAPNAVNVLCNRMGFYHS